MKKTNILLYINLAKMPQNRFWAPLWPKMGTLGTFFSNRSVPPYSALNFTLESVFKKSEHHSPLIQRFVPN